MRVTDRPGTTSGWSSTWRRPACRPCSCSRRSTSYPGRSAPCRSAGSRRPWAWRATRCCRSPRTRARAGRRCWRVWSSYSAKLEGEREALADGAGVEPGAGPAPMTRGAEPRVQQAPQDRALGPPGHGTLHQDDFTVTLRADALLIKVTPLDESVIRLAAPDTYNRLHALAESRRAEAANATGTDSPQLFLVSFFSYQPDVPFQPEDLQLVHQGRLLQARTILP